MTNNLANQVAYLRTSRNFPEDLSQLTVEVNKTYVDIANAVNARTIGIFPITVSAITGESWFINQNRRQQVVRQVYRFGPLAFGASTLLIPHGIKNITEFTRIYGTCVTDLPDYRPIPYASTASVANNIDLRVDATNIIIINGTGAGAPNIVQGLIILEWLIQP